MTKSRVDLTLGLAALFAAAPAAADTIIWTKDMVRQAKARLAEEGPAQATRIAGVPVVTDNLPRQQSQSCLKPATEFLIEGGEVFAEYSCCAASAKTADCQRLRFSFPSKPAEGWRRGSPGLRYDAARRSILWGDEVVAVHGDPADHGPYWNFFMAKGFELKAKVVKMSIEGRAMPDWVLVGVTRKAADSAPAPVPSGLNRCGR